MATKKSIFEELKAGTSQIIPENELRKKLESGKKLRVKLGCDPTAPDLHLGHAVVLSKLKQFQDLGHEIIFLVGDFTARIGDPTGRSKARPPLSDGDIAQNTKSYFEQVGRILDPERITVRYNSEWLANLSSTDIVDLCAKVTLARLIERDDFAKRMAEKAAIGFHELLYPLFQGYDSIELKADVELGGTDQTFNLLMGRFLQEQFGQEPQAVVITPLLEGLDGVQKMSKSLGNTIGLTEHPDQVYGKLMSISDKLMWRYFLVLLGMPEPEVAALQQHVRSAVEHPKDVKKRMAHAVVARFWSDEEADHAQKQFVAVFEKRDYSQAQVITLPENTENPLWIVDLLRALGAISTSSEARRLIIAGAVKIDGEPVTDFKASIAWKSGMQIKVGKHRVYVLG